MCGQLTLFYCLVDIMLGLYNSLPFSAVPKTSQGKADLHVHSDVGCYIYGREGRCFRVFLSVITSMTIHEERAIDCKETVDYQIK